MNLARTKLILLALLTVLIIAAAPTSASALGPKPTLTGIPKLTNAVTLNFTLSTTVPSDWIVDFTCEYSNAPLFAPCTPADPTCVAALNGEHTCTETITRYVQQGKQQIRIRAEYCDLPSRSECDANDAFVSSAMEIYGFEVEREKPVVSITGGPKVGSPVLRPGVRSFAFWSNETVPFTCSFGGWTGPTVPCTSPFKVPADLKNGLYRFVVYGTDVAGNRGAATKAFTVDVFHPKKCTKGSSKSAKAKRKKCKAKNAAAKKSWRKKHKLH